jgi:predicted transcriptional regulator
MRKPYKFENKDNISKVSIRLPREIKAKLDRIAFEKKLSLNNVIIQAIKHALKNFSEK